MPLAGLRSTPGPAHQQRLPVRSPRVPRCPRSWARGLLPARLLRRGRSLVWSFWFFPQPLPRWLMAFYKLGSARGQCDPAWQQGTAAPLCTHRCGVAGRHRGLGSARSGTPGMG